MTLLEVCAAIIPADQAAMARAQEKWSRVGKPLGSLGLLEDMVVRMAGIFGTEDFSIAKKAVVPFCADNGVVAEGVTQTGQEVTAAVAGNMARRASSVCRMAKVAGAKVYPVDIGMAYEVDHPGIAQKCIRRGGTGNFVKELAMTRAEAEEAILVGVETARRLTGKPAVDFPRETAIGALGNYVSNETVVKFQPMNINFGILEPLGYKVKGKREKNKQISERALEIIDSLKGEF